MKRCEWSKCKRPATRALTLAGLTRPLHECDEHAALIRSAHQVVADRACVQAVKT